MTQPRGGLGRGLAALLPDQATQGEQGDRGAHGAHGDGARAQQLREVGIDDIRANPRQPRQDFDEAALGELAASVRAVGLLQPIVVRPLTGGGYELIAGERRWRACRIAGLARLPVIVRETPDDHLLRDALIENLQRVDLNPLEEAAAFRQLVDDFGATHEEIAERVGKSRAAVTNALRLLTLSPDVQSRVAAGTLSAAHGRALAAIADHGAQARAAARAVAEHLSVREIENLVKTLSASGVALTDRAGARTPLKTSMLESAMRPAGILQAEVLLSDILATRVTVDQGRTHGKVIIEYADFDDLDRIVRQIEGER